jgi:hypothetical protein
MPATTEIPPLPKFKVGDIVFKSTNQKQGLRIYTKPQWDTREAKYHYAYEYRLGLSDGYAWENQLLLAPPGTTI